MNLASRLWISGHANYGTRRAVLGYETGRGTTSRQNKDRTGTLFMSSIDGGGGNL